MRGRKPKPSAMKRLDGNPGQRPIKPHVEPPRDGGPPECPGWLSPAAKAEWARLAPDLTRMGLLHRVDATAFAAYCQCYARWAELEQQVTRDGAIGEDRRGNPCISAAARLADQLLKQIRSYAVEFGFTPSSRCRIEVPGGAPSAEKDEFEEFLKGS